MKYDIRSFHLSVRDVCTDSLQCGIDRQMYRTIVNWFFDSDPSNWRNDCECSICEDFLQIPVEAFSRMEAKPRKLEESRQRLIAAGVIEYREPDQYRLNCRLLKSA